MFCPKSTSTYNLWEDFTHRIIDVHINRVIPIIFWKKVMYIHELSWFIIYIQMDSFHWKLRLFLTEWSWLIFNLCYTRIIIVLKLSPIWCYKMMKISENTYLENVFYSFILLSRLNIQSQIGKIKIESLFIQK